ncbi:hypothetical protein [Neorhizobium petrolearium]|uniref:hypothetical protein n=1 Tax=Neorhizobium petrolearium TaxID=515361 RepID=UPI003F5CC04E
MAEITSELMYELLKKLHQRFDKVDLAISELRADHMTLRGQLHVLQGGRQQFARHRWAR